MSIDFLPFKCYFPRVSIEKARVMTRHQRHDGICGSCNKMLAWKISIGVRISKGEMSRADFYQYRSTKVSSLAASSQRNVFITQTKLCLYQSLDKQDDIDHQKFQQCYINLIYHCYSQRQNWRQKN